MAVKPELAVKPASAPLRTAQAHGDDMVRSRGFEVFARSGFVARAAIYGIIGVLALKLALGDGGRRPTSEGHSKPSPISLLVTRS